MQRETGMKEQKEIEAIARDFKRVDMKREQRSRC